MTLANQITILRLFLIPVFVALVLYYEFTNPGEARNENLRIAAIIVFLVAAISDGVDGFIARRYNQKSKLGALLDPIADKGLVVTAILLLSWSRINDLWRFPLWFPILIFSRDIILVIGFIVLHLLNHKVEIRPNWAGKTATALIMTSIISAMVRPSWLPFFLLIYAAGVTTAISLILYTIAGLKQLDTSHISISK